MSNATIEGNDNYRYWPEENNHPLWIVSEPQKSSAVLSFYNTEGRAVGTLDFNGSEMKFTGEADEAAKVFFKYLAMMFSERLKQERESVVAVIESNEQ